MCRAGVNTEVYGAHSVRSASTSKAKSMSVPITDIMKKAGWSNKSTFARFYDKDITRVDKFTNAVLKT